MKAINILKYFASELILTLRTMCLLFIMKLSSCHHCIPPYNWEVTVSWWTTQLTLRAGPNDPTSLLSVSEHLGYADCGYHLRWCSEVLSQAYVSSCSFKTVLIGMQSLRLDKLTALLFILSHFIDWGVTTMHREMWILPFFQRSICSWNISGGDGVTERYCWKIVLTCVPWASHVRGKKENSHGLSVYLSLLWKLLVDSVGIF